MIAKKTTAGLMFAFLCLSPLKALAGISPVKASAWDYKDFCGNTVPAYVDAYKDGEKEIIIMNLHSSPSFIKLEDDQKKAFLRILEYFSLMEKNGYTISDISKECQEYLDKALKSTNWESHEFCQDAAYKTADILVENAGEQNFRRILGVAYRKCMAKIINKGHK